MSEAEPTFLQQLGAARETESRGDYRSVIFDGKSVLIPVALTMLLLNNASKIERLIEAAEREMDDDLFGHTQSCDSLYFKDGTSPPEFGTCDCVKPALAALNGEPR